MRQNLAFRVRGLKDKNGESVQIGDTIKVTLSGVDILAILYCTASGGLRLSVIKIITPKEDIEASELKLVKGQTVRFKYAKLDFVTRFCPVCYSHDTYEKENCAYDICNHCGASYCPGCNSIPLNISTRTGVCLDCIPF